MKKIIGLLIVMAMLMAIATSVSAMGMVGGLAEMALGENAVEMPVYYDEEWDEYYPMPANLMWAVTEAGTLTIDFADDDEFGFYANIYVSHADGNMDMSGIYEKGGAATVDVVVGDTVMMEVGCMDVLSEEGTITAHFTMTMGAGEPAAAGTGTEEDPWIVESLPATLTGTISAEDAANEEFMGYYYQYTVTEACIVDWSDFSGCGVFVTVNGVWQDADSWEAVEGDVILVNVWDPTYAGCEYVVVLALGEAGEDEGCTHEWLYLEYDFCYEEEGLYDLYEYCPDCGYIGRRYTPGTEKNPILLDNNLQWNDAYSEAIATVTVGAGETVWYGINRVSGMLLSINGVEMGTLEPADPWDFWAPCTFELVNDTDAEVTYEIKLSWPLGTEYNPDEMPVNETFELYLPENSYEYAYRWYATEDGTLIITVEGENWLFYVNNWGNPDDWSDDYYGDRAFDCYGDPNTITIEVKAGDEVLLYVGTQDADWNAPETTLTITTVFTPAGGEGPCAHEGLVHIGAVEPGCHFNGNIEYWVCYDCEGVWADEALTQVTNILSVVRPALGGEVVHVEAKAPSCYEEGNIEHWYCETCEQVWQDEALTQLTNHMNVKLGAEHTNLVHMEAKAPGCHFDGNIEYWVCYDCGGVWQDEDLKQVTNIKNVVDPALGGEVIHVEAKAPSCYEEGNIEHWYCETCEQVWQDEALTQLTNHMNVKLGVQHTKLVHVDAVAPGCHFDGNIEYWVCYDCGGVWQDEDLKQVTNIKNVVDPALGGEVVHVEAKAPTCTEEGNIEHWYCEKCQQVWQDEALTQLTNHMNVKLGVTEHTFVDGVCTSCGANDQNVPPTGDMIAIAFALVAASGMTVIALPKKKEN